VIAITTFRSPTHYVASLRFSPPELGQVSPHSDRCCFVTPDRTRHPCPVEVFVLLTVEHTEVGLPVKMLVKLVYKISLLGSYAPHFM
jgi:hypothetical protein